MHLLHFEVYYISFTPSVSALPMGDLQAWSWTAEPRTPQPFQCMMATSCSKVNNYHKSFIISVYNLHAELTCFAYQPSKGKQQY